ncbi:hypothetical protein AJ80_06784 [Polytolypa hystricis UAMH7299]|uniref:L-ascorbate oxidase n=1 Tax=Polytolypa hystricis (strain UAMH7299) TaxID=1447883 RepID=A0A2B7XTG1_POLH7|nr:hypothetical protein AJ80_06784 [Polytolypa hystricis UAMH7299]
MELQRTSSRRRKPPRASSPSPSPSSPEDRATTASSSARLSQGQKSTKPNSFRDNSSVRNRTLLIVLIAGSLAILSLAVLPILLGLPQLSYSHHPAAGIDSLGSYRDDGSKGAASSGVLDPVSQLTPDDHVYRSTSTLHLNWTVTATDRRPDGVRKWVYLINGAFPGPTIEARSGDRLLISVHNALHNEGVAIHWHGLYMRGANHMDGTAGITQCPIPPGSSFLYNFTIADNQSGTFWYHAHSGVQKADGLYGGLVIHRPAPRPVRGIQSRRTQSDLVKFNYQNELLLLIGDWYHRPAEEVLKWYMRAASFANEPVPDSLLINGAGRFDCSMAVPARPLDCVSDGYYPPRLGMDPAQSYRIRVVNTGSLSGFSIGFEHGTLDLIQMDGGIDVHRPKGAKASKAKSIGVLYPGQRMDFILRHPRNKRGGSSITVELDPDCFKYPNPALTSLQTFKISTPDTPAPSLPKTPKILKSNPKTHIDMAEISSSASVLSALAPQADKLFVVYTKITQLAKHANEPWGFFNQTSWRPQADPPAPLIKLSQSQWDGNQFAISTGREAVWVDFVVNNLDEGAHPFHLHGHNFYILSLHESSIGWGSYNPFLPTPEQSSPSEPHIGPPYDLTRAVLRDTVQIPRRGHAVLRFRADNPGVWLFHCHIMWHLASGMAMVVDIGDWGAGNGGTDEAERCYYV